jgi:hypothetical protein
VGANVLVAGIGLRTSFNMIFANLELRGVSESASCGDKPRHLHLSSSFSGSMANHAFSASAGPVSGDLSVLSQSGRTIIRDISEYAVNYRGELNGTVGVAGTYSLR